MIDQLIISDKASFDDFGASVASRTRKPPKKKSIKETVPFSNITHDFTAINGEIYWEDQQLEYVFEMIAPTPERLEEMKTAFSSWVMNIIKQELHDPIIPDCHYLATYEDMSFADEEGMEKTTVSVVFSAYPYKIANYPKVYECSIPARSEKQIPILNESSHRITPKITVDVPTHLWLGDVDYSMSAGTTEDEAFKLEQGLNFVTVFAFSTPVNISISFHEEVF